MYILIKQILASHTHTHTAIGELSLFAHLGYSFLFVNTSWAILQCVLVFNAVVQCNEAHPWNHQTLWKKYFISDLVLWNNSCISQGRLTAVTNIPKSPWFGTLTVCFSFTSRPEDLAWKISRASAGSSTQWHMAASA